jgi:CheY-like chemotaxis protein
VRALGGTLTFETEVGRGTTFRVSLPPSAAARAAADAAPAADRRPRAPRVLVVDDDQGIVRLLARVLRRYDVTTALSAEEALAHVRNGPPFALVLSDIVMPDRDGIELHTDIAAIDPSLARRMVFITGAMGEADRARLATNGLRVLRKPIDVAAVLALCEELVPATGR